MSWSRLTEDGEIVGSYPEERRLPAANGGRYSGEKGRNWPCMMMQDVTEGWKRMDPWRNKRDSSHVAVAKNERSIRWLGARL